MGLVRNGVDFLFRTAYRGAYRLMRIYWGFAHPETHGALVAVWHRERLLLVKNSYVPYYSLPGGYVRGNETSREAACRELQEELNLSVSSDELRSSIDQTHLWEGKREHIEIFELEVADPPNVRADNREVISAEFFSPEDALPLDLFPPIRDLLSQRVRAGEKK